MVAPTRFFIILRRGELCSPAFVRDMRSLSAGRRGRRPLQGLLNSALCTLRSALYLLCILHSALYLLCILHSIRSALYTFFSPLLQKAFRCAIIEIQSVSFC